MPDKTRGHLRAGQSLDGFTVEKITPLAEVRGDAIELAHEQSGARLLHLHTGDTENLFSISFPTPPPDNSGLPHVLEHAVLAGSRKYPIKEPFFEMIKMSMATFINAMTGPDCTYYPVASNVRQDLFNLADVYFDAVFHPLLSAQTFRREAHHLAPADKAEPGGRLSVNGIVYNEMKGAFSDPETRLGRAQSRGLFPDTLYGLESGGEPDAIPQLTHRQLLDFHKRYYHPGNAYFFFYGNIPTSDYIAFLKPRLAAFEHTRSAPRCDRQPRWAEPRAVTDTYPVGAEETLENKTYLVISWATGDAAEPLNDVRMHLLELVLFGHEAAPLRKALVDSGLGADLIFSGSSALGCEAVFSVGLKGSEANRRRAFEQLVPDALSKIATQGLNREDVLAAFRQASYQYLEIQDMYPLRQMDLAMQSWIYHRDPLAFIRMGEHLATLRKQYEDQPDLFSHLIRERLLDNPHRLTVTLKPDRQMQAREQARFAATMAAIRARFSDRQMRKICADAEELERLNSLANPPEQLARLPQLKVRDLPHKLSHIPTTVEQIAGVDSVRNEVFCNRVNYVTLHFNLAGLARELWAVIPRYIEAIDQLGAAGANYEEIARRRAATTGGLYCQPVITSGAGGQSLCGLQFKMKALDDQIEAALALLHDLLFGVDPRDPERMRDVIRQTLAQYRTDIVHHGSDTALYHAGRGINREGYLAEVVNGLPQLHAVETLNQTFERGFDGLVEQIESVRGFLLAGTRLTVSFTGSEQGYAAVRSALPHWVAEMPVRGQNENDAVDGATTDEAATKNAAAFRPWDTPPREGLAGPVEMAHCAMVMPAPHFSDDDETLLSVGAHLVSHDYVLNEIRLKGNAYGAWFSHNPFARVMQLGSFNDPHIARTLGVFAGVAQFVRDADWTQTDVERAIIATAKRAERPIRPEAATAQALHRHLAGITPQLREERFARLKTATPKAVKRALLAALEDNLPKAAVCVVSNRQKLEDANREMANRPLAIEDMLA